LYLGGAHFLLTLPAFEARETKVHESLTDCLPSEAEQSRNLRKEAEHLRAYLAVTIFALLDARTHAAQALKQSRENRVLSSFSSP
jgi:hypothetical protein